MLEQTYRRRYRLMMIWGRNESQVWQAFIFVFSRQQRFKRRITVHLRAQLRCVIHRSETDSTYRFQSRSPTESLRKTRHLLFIIKFPFALLWDFLFICVCFHWSSDMRSAEPQNSILQRRVREFIGCWRNQNGCVSRQ